MAILSLIISYLLGSISFSYFIGKRVADIDIRAHGSGNAGATNTLRVLGKGPAIVVLILDALKAITAMGIAYWLTDGDPVVYAVAGIFAIIGHNWPVFFSFRGGKGIATTIGVSIFLSAQAFLAGAVVALLVIAITRYVSLGSLVFSTLLPFILLSFGEPSSVFWVSLLLPVLAYIRHYDNIINLFKGTERKLGDQSHRDLK